MLEMAGNDVRQVWISLHKLYISTILIRPVVAMPALF